MQAQQSKEEFEKLTSRYEALLAENESLRIQTMTQYHNTKQTSEDPLEELLDPINLELDIIPLAPSQVAEFTNEFERELLSMEGPIFHESVPQVDEINSDGTRPPEIAFASLLNDESQDSALPMAQLAPTTSHRFPEPETQELEFYDFPTLDSVGPWTFPDSSSTSHSAGEGTVYPSPWSAFGPGPIDTFGVAVQRVDLIQALIQIACTQERMASIDLERAKLRVCEC